jgi:hypothetical protein
MFNYLSYPQLSMNVPNFVSNTVRADIFYGDWDQQRISRLNVASCPTTSRVLVRGRNVSYPTTAEMVQWVFSDAASLSVAQLQLIDGLVGHITELQNDVTYNTRILKEESEGHLKATRDAVCGLLLLDCDLDIDH